MLEPSLFKALHDLGFAIHWLHPKSKRPVGLSWSKGPRATFEELKRKFKPGLNAGVRLGSPSKLKDGFYLGVIDCDVKSDDPKHLSEMRKTFLSLGIGKTPKVKSGRGNGSMHAYVKSKAPLKARRLAQSKEKVKILMPSVSPTRFEKDTLSTEEIDAGLRIRPAWEISIMGEGQQVVLPPSIHPDTGRSYLWADGFAPDQIPLQVFEDRAATQGGPLVRDKIKNWEPVAVDLISSNLADDVVNKIISGVDISDRSAALFGVSVALEEAGFSEREILSVLTDPKNFLGQVAYDHAKTNSRKRAAEWVLNFTLKKAKQKSFGRDDFEIVPDDYQDPEVNEAEAERLSLELLGAGDWRLGLERNQQDGRPKTSLKNLLLIFKNLSDGEPFISKDLFANEDRWVKDMPWGVTVGQSVTDDDCRRIKSYLAHKFRMEPIVEKILEALLICASENSFHPVRDYLGGLQWDGIPRAQDWLETYLGATGPKKYLRAIGLKTLVAMVKRVMEPGCKFDHILILEGDQGTGKSTTARILSSPWFSDAHLDVGDKDAVMNMQGTWVHELGELSAMSRSEVNTLKEFVTRQVDKIRPPYGRLTVAYARQSIFIGTTNNRDYLKDPTGARRFWPVKVHQLDGESLRADRDQLLAEAYWYWKKGEPLHLDAETTAVAAREQDARSEYDELESAIADLLDTPAVGPHFKIFDILRAGGPEFEGLKNDRATQMRIAAILRRLGYANDKIWGKGMGKPIRRWHRKT